MRIVLRLLQRAVPALRRRPGHLPFGRRPLLAGNGGRGIVRMDLDDGSRRRLAGLHRRFVRRDVDDGRFGGVRHDGDGWSGGRLIAIGAGHLAVFQVALVHAGGCALSSASASSSVPFRYGNSVCLSIYCAVCMRDMYIRLVCAYVARKRRVYRARFMCLCCSFARPRDTHALTASCTKKKKRSTKNTKLKRCVAALF